MSDHLVELNKDILSCNYYFKNYKRLGFTKEQITSAGLMDNIVRVHKKINPVLVKVDKALREFGFRLYVKEGYRPREIYQIAYERIVSLNGQGVANRLFNLKDMPHVSGKSVDAVLAKENGEEIFLRDANDGLEAFFVDFYKDKEDEMAKKFQFRQALLINIMQDHGFRLGTKREYFHFDYRPDHPRNY